MATVLPMRPNTNSTGTSTSTSASRSANGTRQASLSSFPRSRKGSQATQSDYALSPPQPIFPRSSKLGYAIDSHRSLDARVNTTTTTNPNSRSPQRHAPQARTKPRKIKSQYPAHSTEKHVEYILVASFDIDRGSVMEHQYPGPVGGDEHMLAELMLPDQTHLRSQDWTIFFLHKDASGDEEEREERRRRRRRRRRLRELRDQEASPEEDEVFEDADFDDLDDDDEGSDDESSDDPAGPPLVYVLNLVNTKQDNTVKRGAVVKAMAVCTRHSFLHIYKPLLLLALEQYFASPHLDTLASLYNAVNSMDLSLMPRLSGFERFILQSTDAKDLFIEKFEAIIQQRMAAGQQEHPEDSEQPMRTHYGLPRDTHEFESVVRYANIPIPIKVPVALSAETVGDFSLIKLVTMFSTPHATSPQPFAPTHPHLTTSGALTHPIIVLLNAILAQKRVIFLGHNLPSSEVAEAVLAACALASGGMLRGFTRHAFPYTDLTKIDDLLRVPGFIAGVTNPAFAHKNEWWDLLCDLGTGRMKISSKVEQAALTEGVLFFHQPGYVPSHGTGGQGVGMSAIATAGASLSAGLGGSAALTGSMSGDATGDAAFMQSVLKAIEGREGEGAVRSKFKRWIVKFTRLAAAFEELVYGASVLELAPSPKTPQRPFSGVDNGTSSPPLTGSPSDGLRKPSLATTEADMPPEVTGHGYVWPTAQAKTNELAANATRIEGWRTTRSYYNFIQDMAAYWAHRPIQNIDLQHLHDKLAKLRLGHEASASIYLAICEVVVTPPKIDQLLAVVVNAVWDPKGAVVGTGGAGGQGQGLFYLGMGLFHPKIEVREAVAELLGRVQEHEAGRHFWQGVGGFVKMGWGRVMAGRGEAERKGSTVTMW